MEKYALEFNVYIEQFTSSLIAMQGIEQDLYHHMVKRLWLYSSF